MTDTPNSIRDILEQYGEQVYSFAPDYYPNIKKPMLSLDQAEQAINAYILGEVMELIEPDDPLNEQLMEQYKKMFGVDCKEYQEMNVIKQANVVRAYYRNKANKRWKKD